MRKNIPHTQLLSDGYRRVSVGGKKIWIKNIEDNTILSLFVNKNVNRNRAISMKKAGKLTRATVQKVYESNIKRYKTLTCYLCLKPIPFGKDHLEHKTPISRGGKNRRNNLAVACSKCNLKKHTRTEKEYRESIRKK